MRIHRNALCLWGFAAAFSGGVALQAQDVGRARAVSHAYAEQEAGPSYGAILPASDEEPVDESGITDPRAVFDESAPAAIPGTLDGYGPAPDYVAEPCFNAVDGYNDMVHGDGQYGTPEGLPAMAYPEVSPYDHSFNQFYRQQGLWFNRWNNEPRRYMFDLEYLRGNLQSPNTTPVGDQQVANGFHDLNLTHTLRPVDPTNQDFYPQYTTRALNGKGDQFANFMHGIPSDGIRGKFIIENPDSSRFEASVWWFAKVQDHFDPEGFPPFNPNDITSLRPLGSIFFPDPAFPLAPRLPQGAQQQLFDKSYDLFFRSQAYGSDVDWVSTPFFERGSFKLRWMAGVKWVKIREQFLFIGQDSGLSYSVDPTTGAPLVGSIQTVPGISPYTAALNAASTNTLAGPQIGIRYEIGGEKLKIWGQSRFAVAANNNSVGIGGFNMGDPFINPFPTATPTNPRPTAFGTTQTRTNVSPIFDTQIFAESYVLRYVPLLNKIYIFNRAKFRVGYNFMVVSDVVRPNDSIRWLAPTPVLNPKHTNWAFGATSLGLEWKF